MYTIYLPYTDIAEKLMTRIDDLAPGMLSYKLALEIHTEDPNLAAFLKTISDGLKEEKLPF